MTEPHSLRVDAETALDRAVAFLRRSQLPHGEFRTFIGTDLQLSNALLDSSPFVTTFVLHALSHLDRNQVDDMVQKALDFLEREMEFGGVWRYYSSLQYKHCRIPPDLDDTACSTYALRRAGRKAPDNEWIFRHCTDDAGRFLTWVVRKGPAWTPRFWFARFIGSVQAERARWSAPRPRSTIDPRLLRTRRDPVPPEDLDPVVNANVVLLFGERPETAAAVQYLIDFVRSGPQDRFSFYYRDILALYYMVARAYRCSAPSLGAVGGKVTDEVLRRQQADGSFGSSLSTALAASVLQTFAPDSPALAEATASILGRQRDDGSWEACPFYCGESEFWGSEELTTAFCVEVLARHREPDADDPGPGQPPSSVATTPAIDLHSAEFHRSPYPVYDSLRRNGPVYYDRAGDSWVVSRYADVLAVIRDIASFSSGNATFESTLSGADAPSHIRMRRIAGQLFTNARVAALTDRIRTIVNSRVDAIAASGTSNLVDDLAYPLPMLVVAWIIEAEHVPLDDLRRWSAAMVVTGGGIGITDQHQRAAAETLREFSAFIRDHMARKLRGHDGGPLAPLLSGDDRLSLDELVDLGMLLVVAGSETSARLIGSSAVLLAREPQHQVALRANPERIVSFVEEVLRYESPVQSVLRLATQATAIGGVDVPKGSRIQLLIGSANRDPEKFPDPDCFQIDRTPNDHVAFGFGPHFCLGARLARLEAKVLLEVMLERLDAVAVAPSQDAVVLGPSFILRGPSRLNLVFRASPGG
jgi:cytochrome P450